jgi:hypothetical protein
VDGDGVRGGKDLVDDEPARDQGQEALGQGWLSARRLRVSPDVTMLHG